MISNELLKKKILSDAVHGRLVENEQKYIKEIYQKYESKSELFEIPSNWKWINLNNVCQIIFSAPSPKYSINENDNYCLGQKNNQSYGLDLTGMKYCTDEFMKYYKKEYYLQKGDVLLNSLGTGSVGRIGIFDLENDKYITDGHLLVFRHNNDLNEKFLFYVMKYFENIFEQMAIGSTHQAFLKINILKNFEIPFCSLEEQEKIVKKIEELFELIDKKEKNDKEKEKLKTLLKEKILDSAIHGKLVENDLSLPAVDVEETKDAVPFDIPSNWKYTYLNNVGIWKAGSTPLKDNLDYYRDGNIPWVLTGDLNDGILSTCKHYITEKAFNECSLKLNKIGSVLIAMYGATIGKVAINSMKVTTNQACCACECYDKIIYNKYLFYYLIGIREELKAKAEGAGQPNISKQKIINYKILLPPLEQQKKIVEKIEECFKLIEQL